MKIGDKILWRFKKHAGKSSYHPSYVWFTNGNIVQLGYQCCGSHGEPTVELTYVVLLNEIEWTNNIPELGEWSASGKL